LADPWTLAAIAAKFCMYLGILTAAGTVFASLIFRLEHTKAFAQSFAILGLLASMLAFSLGGRP
jgi:putative copper resistance protein D